MLILKVEDDGLSESRFVTRVVSPNPVQMVEALRETLA